MDKRKKIILFGAGQIGKRALSYFGTEKVHCFADNNASLSGSYIDGTPVISFKRLTEIYTEYQIVISTDVVKAFIVATQLEETGIKEYDFFLKILLSNQKNAVIKLETYTPKKTSGTAKKNVLMITYAFPPLSGSGVFRSLKFVKYLPQFGWNPIVFAAERPRADWNYSDESLLDEIPDTVDVIRIPDTVGTMQENSLWEKKDVLLSFLQEALKHNQKAEALFTSFLQSRMGTAEMLVFPCAALLWAYQVVQYIEKNLDIHQIHVIYTSSDPYSAHLVGLYLKEKCGIPWIADYRDPWTGDPTQIFDYAQPRNRLLRYLETILLEKADRSVTTNPELEEDYRERFKLDREKIISITNGYDEDDFTSLRPPVPSKYFTINYSGLLHVNRNIEAVLEALSQLKEEKKIDCNLIRFQIVGDSRQYQPRAVAKKFGLESIINELGYVSHEKALQSNLESHLLLLLGGDSDKYRLVYTGKIFDYLRSGRPILAIAPKNGVVDQTLCETGHGATFRHGDILQIKAMILHEYQKWRRGETQELMHSPVIEKFERRYLTGQLAEVLNAVCKGTGHHARHKS